MKATGCHGWLWGRHGAGVLSRLAFVLAVFGAAPAFAGPLLKDLADTSIACAAEAPFYISRGAETLSTLMFPATSPGVPRDVSVPLAAPALVASEADRVEVLLPQAEGTAKPRRIVFKRTFEPSKSGARKPVVSLHVDDDDVGDDCSLKRGRAEFVSDRFNVVREALCGNDPAPTCIRLLKKTCGLELAIACAAGLAPELEATSKAYFDALNARAQKR